MTPSPINIVSAVQTGPHCLQLTFDDKTLQNIDFEPFLLHSHHPEIRAYLEPERFASFRLAWGELVWGDYELCFPVADLYRNTIVHTETLSEAA